MVAPLFGGPVSLWLAFRHLYAAMVSLSSTWIKNNYGYMKWWILMKSTLKNI